MTLPGVNSLEAGSAILGPIVAGGVGVEWSGRTFRMVNMEGNLVNVHVKLWRQQAKHQGFCIQFHIQSSIFCRVPSYTPAWCIVGFFPDFLHQPAVVSFLLLDHFFHRNLRPCWQSIAELHY